MNKSEKELEDLVRKVETTRSHVPPIFELYVTVFSISISIFLFTVPGVIYGIMGDVMAQEWWAICFFVACMSKSIGLILDSNWLRIIGLLMSGVVYLLMTGCFITAFPNVNVIAFGCMAIFSLVSIPFVKHTSITNKGMTK